ncbi:alpha/beta fold hydrolase [Bacillus sp. 31A1R]|uniref:Alpha/beta fold hydrolase n=1 Tax=Robertmurraya mangrovi TaxID=3098077 RepID=A0ABU5IWN3_9BACI|nr:alpha/beta fold hydrolase [Bacillus sp. 31A1R]MDZ5471574.1 alpha/beta fold hydrolase [Bacillus sp. 31A1R]
MYKQIHINWNNKKLAGTIHYPLEEREYGTTKSIYPLVIICHGFVGSRIGVNRLFVKTAEELIKENCIVVRFDYSGCGESEGHYGDTCLDELIDQTTVVIDYALGLSHVDKERVFLLGHSLGGATALLTVVRDTCIKHLIMWSAVAKPFEDITNIVGTNLVRGLGSTNKLDYLGYSFSNKFFESLKKYQPLKELERFTGDVLLIHGKSDEEIPVAYCTQYNEAFNKRVQGLTNRVEVDSANHTYSCEQSFRELIAKTKEWVSVRTSQQLV